MPTRNKRQRRVGEVKLNDHEEYSSLIVDQDSVGSEISFTCNNPLTRVMTIEESIQRTLHTLIVVEVHVVKICLVDTEAEVYLIPACYCARLRLTY